MPPLYESLEIACPEGLNPRARILEQFAATELHVESSSGLKFVKHLALTSDFENLTRHGFRCWHQRIHDDQVKEDDVGESDRITRKCRHGEVVRNATWEECGFRSWGPDSICVCERRIDKPRYDSNEEPDFYEDDFRDFCDKLSEDSLQSFR